MNARVLLLVLVTGLFMGAWDGDQAVMQAAIAKRNQQRQQAMANRSLPTADDPIETKTCVKLASLPASPAQLDNTTTKSVETDRVTETPVPLPDSIAHGRYQAVSQSGESRQITVSEESATTATSRDFYMVDAKDGTRWYLIRVQ